MRDDDPGKIIKLTLFTNFSITQTTYKWRKHIASLRGSDSKTFQNLADTYEIMLNSRLGIE